MSPSTSTKAVAPKIEWTRTYTVSKAGRFELEAAFGSIELLPATGQTIELVSTRTVRARSDEAARDVLKQLQMQEEVAPDRVSVKAVPLERRNDFRRVNVEYQVKVPAGLNVVLKMEFGNVTLSNVEGQFDLATTNGRILGRAVSGGLQAQAINGQVIMEMATVTRDIRITTVNAALMLGLPPNLNGVIEATTINGNVSVHEGLQLVALTKERQRLSARLGTGSGPRIELQATNGNVRLGGGKPPT